LALSRGRFPDKQKLVDYGPVGVKPLGLAQHRFFPFDAKPAQILVNAGDMLLAGAALINILKSQQKAPTHRLSRIIGKQSREGMAQMQATRGGRREPFDN